MLKPLGQMTICLDGEGYTGELCIRSIYMTNKVCVFIHGSRFKLGRGQSGYTLVELVLVVGIIMVVMGIAVPAVKETMEAYRLETSAALVAGKLREARISAIKMNRNVWLKLDTPSRKAQVQYTDGGTIDLGAPGFLASGIGYVAPTPTQVTFGSLGWPTTPTETIKLQVDGGAGNFKNVTISAAGKITVN